MTAAQKLRGAGATEAWWTTPSTRDTAQRAQFFRVVEPADEAEGDRPLESYPFLSVSADRPTAQAGLRHRPSVSRNQVAASGS